MIRRVQVKAGARRVVAVEHDHERLVETMLQMRASIVLSGFDHPSYTALKQDGFERLEFDHHITASLAGRRPVTEVIWRRVAAGQNLTPTLRDTA